MGFTALLVSMGHQASGALELFNYPLWLRNLIAHDMENKDRPDHIDLAALEVYRDRERRVVRYNDFHRGLFLIPISKWEDLTDKKKIKGFAINETAFISFLLMALRKIEAEIASSHAITMKKHAPRRDWNG
ncbi:alpha-dioxygenase 1 [Cucumis melo var. makuwa]|uniref:Alpha-dioxygenase 1 n=1 Tax=Cucumis melo var. makuwa TaxID=1194695 RepID=A0A5D3CS07_CUCMM|nr:alpha-dioxygenase 1 [Cucumis melo var. makuwa]TYK13978.1 alpha-dioxygenase 1 [Cucumis melo var. makuwa]